MLFLHEVWLFRIACIILVYVFTIAKDCKPSFVSRWALQNRALAWSTTTSHFEYCWLMENSLFKKTQTWPGWFLMGLAVGHSAQSICKRENRKKSLQKLSELKHEVDRVNVCFVIPLLWFASAAPINLCSNLWVSAMHSKLNCCLFYSVGVKAPACHWMLGGPRLPGCSICCWHNTIPERFDLPKQNVTVIVKIYINGKELTRLHSYQMWQT